MLEDVMENKQLTKYCKNCFSKKNKRKWTLDCNHLSGCMHPLKTHLSCKVKSTSSLLHMLSQ